MNTLFESTPKQEADAIEMLNSAIPVVHEGSSTLVNEFNRVQESDSDEDLGSGGVVILPTMNDPTGKVRRPVSATASEPPATSERP
jgi:hypothetical protein